MPVPDELLTVEHLKDNLDTSYQAEANCWTIDNVKPRNTHDTIVAKWDSWIEKYDSTEHQSY